MTLPELKVMVYLGQSPRQRGVPLKFRTPGHLVVGRRWAFFTAAESGGKM